MHRMSSITIRPATSADLDRITEIYADAVTHGTASYELEPPGRAEMGARFDDLMAGGFPYLVAEKDGAVLGYAYAGAFRPRPAYRFIVENSVYVAPQAKGQGVGLLLMQGLIEAVQGGGLSPDHRCDRRRPSGQRLGASCMKSSAFAIRPPRRLRLQARTLAGHGVHAAVAEWRGDRFRPIRYRCRSGNSARV